MTIYGESLSPSGDILANLVSFKEAEIAGLESARQYLEEALPVVADIESINLGLVAAGRADLRMSNQAEMVPMLDPIGTHLGTNFTPKFRIVTDLVEQESTGALWLEHAEKVPILITRAELEALRLGNWTYISGYGNHAKKPAFQRMLVLFPDLTIDLVLQAGERPKAFTSAYIARLFAAYQLMSKLVDPLDKDVVNAHGEIDKYYILSH